MHNIKMTNNAKYCVVVRNYYCVVVRDYYGVMLRNYWNICAYIYNGCFVCFSPVVYVVKSGIHLLLKNNWVFPWAQQA